MNDWYDTAEALARGTPSLDGRWPALPADWRREMVALMLVQRHVNNGGYLQFLSNHGRMAYEYAARALRAIGADPVAGLLDRCQKLVDKHFPCEGRTHEELGRLPPNQILDRLGKEIKPAGSVLPKSVVQRLRELSCEYMALSDDVARLAEAHYGPLIAKDRAD